MSTGCERGCECIQETMGKSSRGSAKKPLRVIIVLVIIAMCLSMADGAPKHKRRHARGCQHKLEPLGDPKTRAKNPKESHLTPRPIGQRMHKIQKRLTNTLAKFSMEQNNLNETKRKASGKAAWLPKVNFVDIVRNNHGGAVKRFELLVPKLHKNMKNFQVIFDCLQKVNVEIIDSSDPELRQRAIKNHQRALNDLITDVEDGMREFNRCIPPANSECNAADMERLGFNLRVSQTQRMEQDALAYRAYTKTLKNWKRAFRCGLPNLKDKVFCRKWRQQFEQRRKDKQQH